MRRLVFLLMSFGGGKDYVLLLSTMLGQGNDRDA